MGTKSDPATNDCYAKAEDDEPMFTLLARDPLAPVLVAMWAEMRLLTRGPSAKVDEAHVCAGAMRAWKAWNDIPHIQLTRDNTKDVCDWVNSMSNGRAIVSYDDRGCVWIKPAGWVESSMPSPADVPFGLVPGDWVQYRDGRFFKVGYGTPDGARPTSGSAAGAVTGDDSARAVITLPPHMPFDHDYAHLVRRGLVPE